VTLEWTASAIQNLYALHSYLLDKNASVADEALATITSSVDRLRENPRMGRPGRVDGTRELVIHRTAYLVAYVVRPAAIRVLAVLHGKQRWPTAFVEVASRETQKVN